MSVAYPLTLKKLIETLALLPGLGEKSATRLSLYLLSRPDLCETLGELIKELPYKVKLCKFCRNLSEEEICPICRDESRDSNFLCIVENPVNLFHIENTGIYRGYYWVLHYLMSPKDGIGPKELGLDHLLFLIQNRNIKEVIIALSPTLAGEATAAYILEVLKDYPVKVTKIACGIPMGMELQFVDPLTLKKALSGRELLKEK
ncbi:recombination mediator RecR [Thermodesulfobacterium hydrogeniphilum]|uniref:recombination mediator RecR n=1 Tax=Thermodesulfobacterium hydrogeniphilum TaxID=161156 RepID=UPI00057196D3|nr:recombination mediator RecR [Thermodesulfobacterium hydrogeniphilum]